MQGENKKKNMTKYMKNRFCILEKQNQLSYTFQLYEIQSYSKVTVVSAEKTAHWYAYGFVPCLRTVKKVANPHPIRLKPLK